MQQNHAPGAPHNNEDGRDTNLASQLAKNASRADLQDLPSTPSRDATIKELLEKNLKWSQIIYEQNRKINRKLFWSALAGWLRFLLIAIPLVAGLIFLPSFVRELKTRYPIFFNAGTGSQKPASVNELIELLPLSPEQRDQLKTIIK